MWDATSGRIERTLRSPVSAQHVALDREGRWLATAPGGALPPRSLSLFVFDLQAPRAADPTPLVQKEPGSTGIDGLRLAGRVADYRPEPHSPPLEPGGQALLRLARPEGPLCRRDFHAGRAAGFDLPPGGRGADLVPEPGDGRARARAVVGEAGDHGVWAESDPQGRFVVVVDNYNVERVVVVPLDGSPARAHQVTRHGRGGPMIGIPRLDPAGQQVACDYFEAGNPKGASIRLVDLATGGERILQAETSSGACECVATFGAHDFPAWLPDGRLVSQGVTGLRIWDLVTGSSRQVRPCRPMEGFDFMVIRATPDSRAVVTLITRGAGVSDLSVADLASGASRDITSHGGRLQSFALDPTGTTLVTGDADGLVRVGPLSGEGEPHLLYGHSRAVTSVAVSPDGRWIASGSDDDTIRLWPMPEGPPLHTLPYDALLAKLRSLTNLRVVPDTASATGYKLEPGPFPGWAKAPEW